MASIITVSYTHLDVYKRQIMGNGTRAFAVAAEQPEKDNPLRAAEMTLEDDYGTVSYTHLDVYKRQL